MFLCLLYVPIKGAAPRGTIADLGGGLFPPKTKYKIIRGQIALNKKVSKTGIVSDIIVT